MKRFVSVFFVLVMLTASLGLARPSQAAPIQFSLSWLDHFTDKAGLYTLSDTDVVDGNSALTLAHAISDPALYKSSGEAVSEIVNPLVKKIPTPKAFNQITDGKNGYLYMSNMGDLYSYRLSTGDFAITSASFDGQSITALATTPDGKIFMGVSTLTDTMNCPDHCAFGTGKIWAYDPSTGGLEDYGVPLVDTAAVIAIAPGPSNLIYGIANTWSTTANQTSHLINFSNGNHSFTDLGAISPSEDSYDAPRKSLAVAPNGKVYFSAAVSGAGHLTEYDPVGKTFTDKGSIPDQGRMNSLAVASNSQVYGGTNNYYNGGMGVFFTFFDNAFSVIPSYDIHRGVYAITAGSDDKIYGAFRRGWVPYLFAYDTATGNYVDTGRVKAGDDDIKAIVRASDGRVYALSTYMPNMYSYNPNLTFSGWDRVYFNATTPSGTYVKVDVLDNRGTVILSDVANGVSLADLNPADYESIQLRARLGGGGTVTPSLDSWNVTWKVSGQLSSMSGRVLDANRLPFPNVAVTLNGGISSLTNANGTYTYNNLLPDTYTLTPSLAGYSFWPPTRTVTVPPTAEYLNFTILASAVSVVVNPEPGDPVNLIFNDTQGLPTRLEIATGAVEDPTTFVMTPTIAAGDPGFAFAGHAFEISAFPNGTYEPGYVFQEPVTLTIQYSDTDVRFVTDVSQMTIRWWNGSQWEDAANTCTPASAYTRDMAARTISLPICHLSTYGLFGDTNNVFLPFAKK